MNLIAEKCFRHMYLLAVFYWLETPKVTPFLQNLTELY